MLQNKKKCSPKSIESKFFLYLVEHIYYFLKKATFFRA